MLRAKLKCNILGSSVKFKHMAALTNKTQIMLSFPMTFEFNAVMCLKLFGKLNLLQLRICT